MENDIEQLDIFSVESDSKKITKKQEVVEEEVSVAIEDSPKMDNTEVFQVRDFVEIIRSENNIDPSDELYVAGYLGKKGTIVEIEEKSNPISYWVDFGKSKGIFYTSDMRFIR
jgi:hypothetical protein